MLRYSKVYYNIFHYRPGGTLEVRVRLKYEPPRLGDRENRPRLPKILESRAASLLELLPRTSSSRTEAVFRNFVTEAEECYILICNHYCIHMVTLNPISRFQGRVIMFRRYKHSTYHLLRSAVAEMLCTFSLAFLYCGPDSQVFF